MQPKAKFWVDFFNYLFRVVTFKKIIPQPRKTKRKNHHVALKPHDHNSTLCYVENPNETELQNLGGGVIYRVSHEGSRLQRLMKMQRELSSRVSFSSAIPPFLYWKSDFAQQSRLRRNSPHMRRISRRPMR